MKLTGEEAQLIDRRRRHPQNRKEDCPGLLDLTTKTESLLKRLAEVEKTILETQEIWEGIQSILKVLQGVEKILTFLTKAGVFFGGIWAIYKMFISDILSRVAGK